MQNVAHHNLIAGSRMQGDRAIFVNDRDSGLGSAGEEFFLLRMAERMSSFMPTTSAASTMRSRDSPVAIVAAFEAFFNAVSSASRRPTTIARRSVELARNFSAAGMVTDGPWSPPIASIAIVVCIFEAIASCDSPVQFTFDIACPRATDCKKKRLNEQYWRCTIHTGIVASVSVQALVGLSAQIFFAADYSSALVLMTLRPR